jgi:hypothetical protein
MTSPSAEALKIALGAPLFERTCHVTRPPREAANISVARYWCTRLMITRAMISDPNAMPGAGQERDRSETKGAEEEIALLGARRRATVCRRCSRQSRGAKAALPPQPLRGGLGTLLRVPN